MNELLPIIRRVRRPLVVGDAEPPMAMAGSVSQAAAPVPTPNPEPEKNDDAQAAVHDPARKPANRRSNVA